jgi:DNA polymerase I-like protein with 3'-5' exonuclease and polymerase domains
MALGLPVDAPASAWRAPDLASLPSRLHGTIAVDLETRDDGIAAGKGAGWAWRGGGHVVGYAVAVEGFSVYLPVAHEGGGNVDGVMARRWLNDVLGHADQPKVGAGFMYDVGWGLRDGVRIQGPTYDVLWAEALLDERRKSYALDPIARSYLGRGKDERALREAATAYGLDAKSDLWRLPAGQVGAYGQADAELARDVWALQEQKLRLEELWSLAELEFALLPMYVDMRRRGVRVDVAAAERADVDLRRRFDSTYLALAEAAGRRVDPWAAASIAPALEKEGVTVPRTANGGPSVTKAILERAGTPTALAVLRLRELDKLRGTFVRGTVLENMHDGRVHGEIHPLQGDDGGTVTGRLSMSNPNLQFIPVRTDEGKKIRELFIPEDGEEWASADMSQQEPRLLVHFASLVRRNGRALHGALEAVARYQNDPGMSYHRFTAELTGLEYKAAKILNLAIIYGRGVKSTAVELGRTVDQVENMFARHSREMPFARAMAHECQAVAGARGYIRSLLGRKMRFSTWEPTDWNLRDGLDVPYDEAKKKWPTARLVRARTHKALNWLIQPSAADQTKKAMLDVWKAGLGRHVLVQVHDELGLSVPDRTISARVAAIMEEAVLLTVPNRVEVKHGASWGVCG